MTTVSNGTLGVIRRLLRRILVEFPEDIITNIATRLAGDIDPRYRPPALRLVDQFGERSLLKPFGVTYSDNPRLWSPQYYWDLYENTGTAKIGKRWGGPRTGPAWTWGAWNQDLKTRFGRYRESERGVMMRDPNDNQWSDWWPKVRELP